MELKLDKTTKLLLGAIALGLFLNASNLFIDKAYANDWDLVVELNKSNVKIDRMQENLNIIDKTLTNANLSLNRNMHCWALSIYWTPVGGNQSFLVSLRNTSSIFRDAKIEFRKPPAFL